MGQGLDLSADDLLQLHFIEAYSYLRSDIGAFVACLAKQRWNYTVSFNTFK